MHLQGVTSPLPPAQDRNPFRYARPRLVLRCSLSSAPLLHPAMVRASSCAPSMPAAPEPSSSPLVLPSGFGRLCSLWHWLTVELALLLSSWLVRVGVRLGLGWRRRSGGRQRLRCRKRPGVKIDIRLVLSHQRVQRSDVRLRNGDRERHKCYDQRE